jgi:uncharacterized protein (DUF488 family)
MKLFTIGHSNHSLDKFIRLLEDNGIMTLVDVRTAPHSRYNPQFNFHTYSNPAYRQPGFVAGEREVR